MPPREPRRRDASETRRRLLEAGRKAFSRKGLAGTNLSEDVLGPAGVGPGSFYHQFEDKADLLIAVLEEQGRRFRERLDELMAPGPGARFEDIVRTSFEFALAVADDEGDLLRIQQQERRSADPRVREYIRENRERWIASLEHACERLSPTLGVDLDARLAAELAVKLGLAVVDDYLDLPPRARPAARERVVRGLTRFTVSGLPGLVREAR